MAGTKIYYAMCGLAGVLLVFNWQSGLLVLLILICSVFSPSFDRRFQLIGLLIIVLFVSRSWMNSFSDRSHFTAGNFSEKIQFIERPKLDGDEMTSIVMTSFNEKVLLVYRISSEKELSILKKKIRSGFICDMNGKMEAPIPHTNVNAFDYKDYLHHQGIHWRFLVEKFSFSSCTQKHKSIFLKITKWREWSLLEINHHYGAQSAPIVAALLFGERSMIDDHVITAYQQLGIIHLLSISGLHVSVIFSILYFIMVRLGLTREKAALAIIFLLPCYTLLTGASPPVLRATASMMGLFILYLLKIRWVNLDILSIVFLVLLAYNPQIIYHLGFQLSFIVCFSIFLSQSILLTQPSKITALLLLSFICQVVASPVLINIQSGFSLISPFVNLIFVPLYVTLILPLCLISFVLLLFIPILFPIFGWMVNELIYVTNHIALFLNQLPFTNLPLGSFKRAYFFIFCAILFWCLIRFEKKRRILIAFFPLVFLFAFILLSHSFSPKGEVRFIDIGQGDSILIKRPYGRGTYLIDTGGKVEFEREKWREKAHHYSVGTDTLVPFLKSDGIHHLDLLILTHADFDHIGAATDLLQEIKVDQILITPGSELRPEMKKIVKLANQQKIKLTVSKIGMSWGENGESFKVVSPQDEKYEGNNDSIVIAAEMGGLRWIFTGDLEKEGEDKLLKTFRQKVDVLKVGHHGSSSSTSDQWLKTIQPRIAIISAGRNNLYNHPNPSVIKKLTDRHIKIYSTQKQGMISYLYRGQSGTFQVEIP
jgi:competence protein ComEC